MSSQFPSNNPTAYVGLQVTNPGQNWFRNRDPLPTDFRNYAIGDRWIHVDPLNPVLASIWMLVGKTATAGQWSAMGGGSFAVGSLLVDDANLVNPIAGVITLTGNATQGISTSEPVAGTAKITVADATSIQKGVVTVDSVSHGVLVGTASQSSINSTATGTAGQVFISGGASDPVWTSFINTNPAGIVSLPSQSASSAFVSANAANQTGDLTKITVLFDTKDYDNRTEYTPGTGIFQATVAGLYLVNTVVGIYNIDATHTVANLAINIGGAAWWQAQYNPAASRDAANQLSMQGNVVLPLLAGQQVTVTIQVGGGAKQVGVLGATNIHTEFQVTKLT